ncbi:hypothetical protein ABS767_10870 [Sphingomonas sp. ST-64]|uniref:Uncharacterized protein n=1 Tax=Sphingomonas plantiphila TaxID=3163295 RepID=A0ABW8YMG7_9SPHN
MMTLFHYRYRDANNYKANGTVALTGVVPSECWEAALMRLEESEFFVAEQLDIPPLYSALYEFSNGPTLADHCWHEFVEVAVTDTIEPDTPLWGNATDFTARLLAVSEWKGSLSPHFCLGAYT